MLQKIVTRLLTGVLVLWLAATAAFVAIHALPGRIEDVLAGDLAYPGLREAIAAQWGLDRSLPWQYGQFLLRLSHADLGTSFVMQQPVSAVLSSQFLPTAELAGSAGLLAITAAYGLPISVTLYVRAAQGVLSLQPWRLVDGLGTLTVEGATQALLVGLLIRRWRQRFGASTRAAHG